MGSTFLGLAMQVVLVYSARTLLSIVPTVTRGREQLDAGGGGGMGAWMLRRCAMVDGAGAAGGGSGHHACFCAG